MKIKDCLACRMKEEEVKEFVETILVDLQSTESMRESFGIQYENAEEDPECSFPKDFLDHMWKDHVDELHEFNSKVAKAIYQTAQEVF